MTPMDFVIPGLTLIVGAFIGPMLFNLWNRNQNNIQGHSELNRTEINKVKDQHDDLHKQVAENENQRLRDRLEDAEKYVTKDEFSVMREEMREEFDKVHTKLDKLSAHDK